MPELNNTTTDSDAHTQQDNAGLQQEAASSAGSAALQALPAKSPLQAPDQTPPKRKRVAEGFKNRTKGEAAFNLGAYAGIGYFGVTAFSVLVSWLLRDNKTIAPLYEKYVINPVTHFFKRNKTDPEKLAKIERNVNSNMTIAALFTGGTIMSILPIKWMEDNKADIVKSLDRHFYGKDADNDPAIQQAHRELEAAPHQTWRSVFSSRVLAFVATFSTSLLVGKWIDKYSTRSGRWLDGALHHQDEGIVNSIKAARETDPDNILRHRFTGTTPQTTPLDRDGSKVLSYISMDAFYTLITSGALYVFTRVLAPLFDREERTIDDLPAPANTSLKEAVNEHVLKAEHTRSPSGRISKVALDGRLEAEQRAASLA